MTEAGTVAAARPQKLASSGSATGSRAEHPARLASRDERAPAGIDGLNRDAQTTIREGAGVGGIGFTQNSGRLVSASL